MDHCFGLFSTPLIILINYSLTIRFIYQLNMPRSNQLILKMADNGRMIWKTIQCSHQK